MNKVWEYLIDIFIGILIIFVSVAVYYGLRTETVIKTIYEGVTQEFISDVKKNGVLYLDDYERYMGKMGTGSSLFNIEYEHRYKIFEPEYRFKTLEEILEDQDRAYGGSNDYHYREVVTERPHVDDPINDGNLNTETNESILEKAVNGPSDPNHVHDENCYGGHKHTGPPVFIHTHAHKSGECREYLAANTVHTRCNNCDSVNISGAFYYWNEITNRSEISYSDFSGTARCPSCSSTNMTHLYQYFYYQYSCGYNRKYVYGAPEGAGETVPYNVEFEYERSYPVEQKGTITKGCHTIHYTKYVTDNFDYDDIYGHIIYGSILGGANKMIYTDKFQNYCRVPKYYTVGLFDSTTYQRGDGFNLTHYYTIPNLCYLRYEAYIDGSGTLRFKLLNYRAGYTPSGIKSGTDNPGFPDNITANQLAAMKESQLNNLFYDVFNVNYREMRSRGHGDSIVAHNQCLNSTIGSEQYIDLCGFDHSLGVNRWITTCGYDEDGTMDCDKIIVSLVPTHTEQTVYINDPLITTAIATYRDGSTETVVCTTDFTTSIIEKNQSAILKYNYTIDGLTYTNTCEIDVTVIPRNKTCSKGHTYNLNEDGTDNGCPYCRAWVESLRVINPTISPIVITIGTTLQYNDVKLLATYMDGHTEEVTSGYIDNLDIEYLGTKPVIIGYKGASVTVLVTSVCATMICDICGYEYNLYPDGSNPGCPRCIQKIPVFTGNIMEYEHINHTEEILDILYRKKKYVFNVEDVFSVTVNNKSSTIARKVLRKVYPSLTDRWLKIEKKEHVMSK